MKLRLGLGVLFLFAQFGWVLSGKRPALWAPFHQHAVYSLKVEVEGKRLDTLQSLARYSLPKWHASAARDEAWETNDLQFVKDTIVAFESRSSGPVMVELSARIDGEEQPPWRWAR